MIFFIFIPEIFIAFLFILGLLAGNVVAGGIEAVCSLLLQWQPALLIIGAVLFLLVNCFRTLIWEQPRITAILGVLLATAIDVGTLCGSFCVIFTELRAMVPDNGSERLYMIVFGLFALVELAFMCIWAIVGPFLQTLINQALLVSQLGGLSGLLLTLGLLVGKAIVMMLFCWICLLSAPHMYPASFEAALGRSPAAQFTEWVSSPLNSLFSSIFKISA